MVQVRTLEKIKAQSPEIAQEIGVNPEDVKKVMTAIEERIQNNRRQPREPAPKDGISVRAAARKYKIDPSTITLWHKKGLVDVLKKTKNWLYIDEVSLVKHIESKNGKSVSGKKLHSILTVNANADIS